MSWEDVDRAEQRMAERSAERDRYRQRRERTRNWRPWILCPIVLPALGAAVAVAVLESQGGDLGDLDTAAAIALIAGLLAWPAALSLWAAWRTPLDQRIMWPLVTLAVQIALVVGVGFVALGLGPS